MRALPLSACLLMWAVTLHGQYASNAKGPTLTWGPAPAVFPKGAKMAVVSGDPGKAVPFTVELSFPNGYRIPPHFHPTAESVEVKKGTFLVGMGDTLDVSKTKPLKVGAKGDFEPTSMDAVRRFMSVLPVRMFARTTDANRYYDRPP